MKLLFQQRFFSWLDSYDIYDEAGRTLYSVEGRLAWGHKLVIFDASGREVGLVREEVMTFLPRFTLSVQGRSIGQVCKEWTFFKPSYRLDCLGWQVQGDWLAWDYTCLLYTSPSSRNSPCSTGASGRRPPGPTSSPPSSCPS